MMRRTTNIRAAWVLVVASICLAGCIAPRALKSDFGEYGKGYAESGDRQLLFNLARLANNDSVSFMQLVSISAEHQMTAGLGYNQSVAHNSPGFYPSSTTAGSSSPTGSAVSAMSEYTRNAATYGGTANVGVLEEPTFQFVPLSGSNIVTAVLSPIPTSTFFELYDQGYPADYLMRTMVESIAHWTNITTNFTIEFKDTFPDPLSSSTYPTNLSANFAADFTADLSSNHMAQLVSNQLKRFPSLDSSVAGKFTISLVASGLDSKANSGASKGNPAKENAGSEEGASPPAGSAIQLGSIIPPGTDIPSGSTIRPAAVIPPIPRAPVPPNPKGLVATVKAHVTTNYEYWVNNPYDKSYPQFLQACERLRYYQLNQWLTVNSKAGMDTVIFRGSNQPLKDIISATQSNLTVKLENDVYTVTKAAPKAYEFVKNSNLIPPIFFTSSNQTEPGTYKQMELPFVAESKVDSALTELGFGGAARVPERNQEWGNFASDWVSRSTFKMKAVESAMFTAGKEESYFRKLSTNAGGANIQFTADAGGPFAWVADGSPSSRAWKFSTNDIRDLASFAAKLSQKSDDVSRLLRSKMSFAVDEALAEHQVKTADPGSLQAVLDESRKEASNKAMQALLVEELNRIISNTHRLSDFDAFKKLHLRPQTVALVKQNPNGEDERRLDRLLLEDAYPEEIRSQYFKVYPLMKLTCEGNEAPFHNVLAFIDYWKDDRTLKRYYVGDAKDQTQNRKVFTILTYLFESSAVSTTNLPVQQLIEVH
jgi:hypothetical protein